MYRAAYSDPVITLRIAVQPGDELSPQPVHRSQGHLYTIVASQQNYACLDFETRFGYAWITRATAADYSWFRWFYLAPWPAPCSPSGTTFPFTRPASPDGTPGMLLFGPSGMGKSTLSYACARAGWTFHFRRLHFFSAESRYPQGHRPAPSGALPRGCARLFPGNRRVRHTRTPHGQGVDRGPNGHAHRYRNRATLQVDFLVFLERGESGGVSRLSDEDAMERMLANSGSYGPATFARHERAMRRLLHAPAYRLRYKRPGGGDRRIGKVDGMSRAVLAFCRYSAPRRTHRSLPPC